MADPETEATEPEHGGTDDERLSRLEDGQAEHGAALERIEQALARLVPGSHQEAQERTERRLERPQRAEDATRATVREELARAREDEARQQREAGERESLQSRLAKLEERPPAEHRSPLKRFATHGWGG